MIVVKFKVNYQFVIDKAINWCVKPRKNQQFYFGESFYIKKIIKLSIC